MRQLPTFAASSGLSPDTVPVDQNAALTSAVLLWDKLLVRRSTQSGRWSTMSQATMTSKGQITVPKDVRDDLNLSAGSKVMLVRVGPQDYRS